jgi:hypothetical protein
MHHLLPFYGRHQYRFLKTYIILARLTGVPVLGWLIRWAANIYARRQHGGYFLTYDDAGKVIDASEYVALGPCACRQVSNNCRRPVMAEIVLGFGREVYSELKNGHFQLISKDEAREILRQCHQQGMMHTAMHCQGLYYTICNCCTCCCVPYRLKHDYGIEYAIVRNKNIVVEYQKQQLLIS